MTDAKEYTWCFACGKANPIGLKLEFERTEEECSTAFIPKREHQSYDGRMHGGLISTLLDEKCVFASRSLLAKKLKPSPG